MLVTSVSLAGQVEPAPLPVNDSPAEMAPAEQELENTSPVAAEVEEVKETEAVENDTDDGQRAKGVLRLLQAGHFKGVADVRLRINFNDEITAMENARAAEMTQSGVSSISETVVAEINTLLESEEFDEEMVAALTEARDIFASDLENALAELQEGGAGTEAMTSHMQSSFDDLHTSLSSILTPATETETEPPLETTPAVEIEITAAVAAPEVTEEVTEIEETIENPYDEFLANLQQVFDSALEELVNSLANVSVLPELSQPEGNGKAYDKFLAIYNEMRGLSQTETPETTVETTA